MSIWKDPKVDYCPNCRGSGYDVEYQQVGEDKYGYAIGEEVQIQCGYCGGSGFIEIEEDLIKQREKNKNG